MRAAALILLILLASAGCITTPAGQVDLTALDEAPEPVALVAGRTASESSAATNPLDDAHLIVVSHIAAKDVRALGADFGVHVSRDGGDNWTMARVGPRDIFPPETAARFSGFSDPVVAFGPDGTPYLAGLAYLPDSVVWVARSDDGGESWQGHIVSSGDLATDFHDKEWIAVSPTTGTVLASWQSELALDQLRGVEAATGVDADIGHIMLARSDDGGRTWSDAERISRGAHNNGTQLAFTSDGTAHALWVNYEEATLDYAQSTDDGTTWTAARAVADVDIVGSFERFGRMHTLPALVASPIDATLVAVWHDDRHGDADAMAVVSRDGGATWGEPTRLGPGEAGDGVVQFYPWAAIDADGALWVSYYDATPEPDAPRFRFALQRCDASLACDEPTSASREVIDVFASADGTEGALSIGDYTSITTTREGVFPVWTGRVGEDTALFTVALPRIR